MNPIVRSLLPALIALAASSLAGFASLAVADEGSAIAWNGSGFFTLAAGKVLSGTHDPATDLGYHCPCFISDYAQGGVYEGGGLQFAPDSRIGLQGSASMDGGRYSITAQAVARGARDGRPDLEWLYGTVELNSDWTLQVGRKRLPLFLSSEVQDVGYALPWIHLPPQVYGWDIVNYDGASLTWRGSLGDWLATVNLLAGDESVHDSGYWKIYNGKDTETESHWSDISGAELKLSRDAFEARAVMIQSYTQNRETSAGDTDYSPRAWQRIYGLSFSYDDAVWIARTELLYINREEDYGHDHAQLFAAGRHFGPWLGLVSYANYQQSTKPDAGAAEGHSTTSGVLRYEWDRASSVKLQFDYWHDKVAPGYTSLHGDARLLSLAYDRVF